MGKFTDRTVEKKVEKDHTKSVAWKGIGCSLMIAVPMISIAAAKLTMMTDAGRRFVPYSLQGLPTLPDALFKTAGLRYIFNPIAQTADLYAIIILSLAYMVIVGSAVSLLYAIIFRAINPRKYGPYDAPPSKVKAKKYKR